ncbi:hypothetical protein Pf1_01252 [Flavobacterium columnare]|uniref:hypothetical protein n=1 Tax=Flavobacterium columnare TaxID=996 RepID=UPI0007F9EF90|nr:hypothetical protein [Flavobacterium columnare]ANO49497.1 hypothetical protein Pf1_01252 [Flavobacterium columnare]APT22543.1 hypothetical protein BU993_07860 [Flavobacterium columnare]
MKNIIKTIIILVSNFSIAQVGIGTDTPTATLDVNGTTRIRTLNDGSNSTTYPYFVVADALGNLAKADRPSKLFTSLEPTFTLDTNITSDTQITSTLYSATVTTSVANQVLQISCLIPYRLCDNTITTNPPLYHASTRALTYECILNTGTDNKIAHETVFFSGGNRLKETHYCNLSGNITITTPGTYTLRINIKADAPSGAAYRVEHNISSTTGRVFIYSSN